MILNIVANILNIRNFRFLEIQIENYIFSIMKGYQQEISHQQIINHFQKTLNLQHFFAFLHHITKENFTAKSPINSNLISYLKINDCRKIIQLKQNDFIQHLLKKIRNSYNHSLKDKKQTQQKISFLQIQKFSQLFYRKKSQISHLQCILQKLQITLNSQKQNKKDSMTILAKLKSIIEKIQEMQKFIIKQQQIKGQKQYLSDLKINNFFKAAQKQFSWQKKNIQTSCNKKQSLNRQKLNKPNKNENIIIITQSLNDKQKDGQTDNFKIQIAQLKSEYQRLKCIATQNKVLNRVGTRNKRNFINFFTEPGEDEYENQLKNSNFQKFHQKQPYEDFIQENKEKNKKKFSVLNKSTKNTSLFVKSSAKNTANQNTIGNHKKTVKSYDNQKKQKKKVDFNKKSIANIQQPTKMPKDQPIILNSKQKVEVKKRKTFQQRSSAINFRQKSQINQYYRRKTQLHRYSQSFSGILDKELKKSKINKLSSAFLNQTSKKQRDVSKISEINDIKNQFQQQDKKSNEFDLWKKKQYNHKNRRKAFKKNHIHLNSDDSGSQSSKQTGKNKGFSSIQNENEQADFKEKSERSSSMVNKEITRDNQNKAYQNTFYNNKRLLHRKSATILQDLDNDQLTTQKTIKLSVYNPTQKRIKGILFSVTANDCSSLYQEINFQCKMDHQEVFSSCWQNMMRKKYDPKYKLQLIMETQEALGKTPFGAKQRMIETEVTYDKRRLRWSEESQNLRQMEIQRVKVTRFRHLGQKDMDTKLVPENQQIETLYI